MSRLPSDIKPMRIALRHELPANADDFGWEYKWDGVRAIAYVEDGSVRLTSRTGQEMTGTYPELAVLAQMVSEPVILDGEIVALRDGRPDFKRLQRRMQVQHPPDELIDSVPVDFCFRRLAPW